MRVHTRKITVKLIEKEHIHNQRLVEYLAKKYMERNLESENI